MIVFISVERAAPAPIHARGEDDSLHVRNATPSGARDATANGNGRRRIARAKGHRRDIRRDIVENVWHGPIRGNGHLDLSAIGRLIVETGDANATRICDESITIGRVNVGRQCNPRGNLLTERPVKPGRQAAWLRDGILRVRATAAVAVVDHPAEHVELLYIRRPGTARLVHVILSAHGAAKHEQEQGKKA